MTKKEMYLDCYNWFIELTKQLEEHGYIAVARRNVSESFILCKENDVKDISYKSKPELSFRLARRWNWYASEKKNPDLHYIQCYTRDLPRPHKRKGEGLPSDPIIAACVCLFIGGKYHVVYGEYFDTKKKEWRWKNDISPDHVVKAFKGETMDEIVLRNNNR